MARILIIDDELVIRKELKRLLTRHGYEVAEAGSIREATHDFEPASFDLILTDLRLPGALGTEMIGLYPDVPVLIMTSYASVKSAVEAMRLGAADYLTKPFEHDELLPRIERALERRQLSRQNSALKRDMQQIYPVAGMVGESPAMQEVFSRIRRVAPTHSTVLILGESGTGKELVARALHEQSPRAAGPLIAINCAAIPETLIESELFGYEKGAFTGANAARAGLIEAAHGGTLFLDELGELPLSAQARLLRVLQESEVRRLGASTARKVDLRLIAATHRNLKQLSREGRFREDLYFRLKVLEIHLPPLRDRGDDLLVLAQVLLQRACQRLKKPAQALAPETLDAIRRYSWPGNVRELENAVERAVILSDGEPITLEQLGLEPEEPTLEALSRLPGVHAGEGSPSALSLEAYFKQFVLEHQEQLTETELARQLGISRKALWERRQRLGLPRSSRR